MSVTVKHAPIAALLIASMLLFSCATEKAAVKTDAPPVGKTEPNKGEWSRIAFAEDLARLSNQGRWDEVFALFDSVPQKEAESADIGRLKLSMLISARQLDAATDTANDLEKRFPKDADILYTRAVLAGAQNNAGARKSYLDKTLAVDKNHSDAMAALGLDLVSLKNYKLAKTWLVKAVAANPNNLDAMFGLGRTYYMENELDKARETMDLALERDSSWSILWAERARIRAEQNDVKGAIEDVKKACEIDGNIYSHWVDLGNYYITGFKKAEARDAFSRAIEIDGSQYLAYIYRAGLNDDLGNLDEAIADYRKVCEIFPNYHFAFESLGILLWGKGDWQGSREAFRTALSYRPKNSSYALMTTLCFYREGKEKEAKEFMTKYLALLDRTTTEYFLCRLFVDLVGDADVLNRIMKEKNVNVRNRMLFYSAMYYQLFQSKSIAQKYFLEVISVPAPSFFEYRLSRWAITELEGTVREDTGRVSGT